jgi:hypothetical protein
LRDVFIPASFVTIAEVVKLSEAGTNFYKNN